MPRSLKKGPFVDQKLLAKIDAVATRDVRDFAGQTATAGAALAVYGPAEKTPTLSALRERLVA